MYDKIIGRQRALGEEQYELSVSREGIAFDVEDLNDGQARTLFDTPAMAARLGFALIDAAIGLRDLRERGTHWTGSIADELGDARYQLGQSFEGDSNDYEHDAAYNAHEALGMLTDLIE